MSKENIIKNISIDGPAASGKTSLGQELSKRINYKFLDTGLMYRFVAYQSIIMNVDSSNEESIVNVSKKLEISSFDLLDGEVHLNSKNVTSKLKERRVDRRVSQIAKYSNVRKILVDHQRDIALRNNLVMVGRDIGTVVLPNADYKFYITANPEIRAKRRYKDLAELKTQISFEDILQEIKERDNTDSMRDDSPLIPAIDAIIIDTSRIDFENSILKIMEFIEGEQI